jgi:hypothetical protein
MKNRTGKVMPASPIPRRADRPYPLDWQAKQAVENHENGLTACIGINHRCVIEINGELIEFGMVPQKSEPLIFRWWSREHLRANRVRRQRRRKAKRERKHWDFVNGRGAR